MNDAAEVFIVAVWCIAIVSVTALFAGIVVHVLARLFEAGWGLW